MTNKNIYSISIEDLSKKSYMKKPQGKKILEDMFRIYKSDGYEFGIVMNKVINKKCMEVYVYVYYKKKIATMLLYKSFKKRIFANIYFKYLKILINKKKYLKIFDYIMNG